MFTVCPKCALTLVVTAADLRVAQGYVRCGRCSSVFNALAQLSDERAAAAAAAAAPPPPEQPAPPSADSGADARPEELTLSPDADSLEFNPATTDASSVFVKPPPSPEWTAATGSFKALIAANQEPVAEAPEPQAAQVDVELDAALLSDIMETGSKPAPPPSPAAPPAAPPRRASPARPAAAAIEPEPSEEVVESAAAPEAAAPPSATGAALRWGIGAAILVLALIVQVIDHERDALAADTRFNRPLTALYSALGVRLMPRWDLRAYDVHQLGATVEPGNAGAITVRASIRNVGTRAQPLPLLRVTLQDRFGNRLASRDVQPHDYLPPSATAPALLSVDQRIDAQLAFVDPGASAVGFELDACLPARGGGVACANDASAR